MSKALQDTSYKLEPDNTSLDRFPGNFGLPIIGHMIEFVKDLRGLVTRQIEKHGAVSKINFMGNKGLLVAGPDAMQKILLDPNRDFSNEMGFKNNLAKFFEGGILLRDFDEHKVQRRIFQSAFKNDPMRTYVQTMNEIMSDDMDAWQDIENFVLFPHIKKTLLTTACKIFVGVERGTPAFDRLYKDYIDMLEGMASIIQIEIPGSKWAKSQAARRDINDFFREQIPAKRKSGDHDFLSFFTKEKMDNGDYFSDEDIVKHMNFLVFAAHDTTTASIINVLYQLALNPEWQERIRQSCKDFATEHNKEALSYDDLEEIADLEHTMLEAQRLHPSVPLAVRRTIREVELEGQKIPAHTKIWLPYFAYYRCSKWWTNAEKFDPDRFGPGREEHKGHSFLFIPFGGGAHKCIGMHFAKIQVKCFLFQFIQRYRFSVPEGYAPWEMLIPMPKPADGLPLKLERITQA
ncbi:MAG: cytochrome P450 [Pseudomonadales bacterium]|nr:cytochrome P450 [Pseudomonadales bacterium]